MTAQRLSACVHQPPCPGPDSADHDAARIVASHPEQGWSLLCNGIVLFEDTGELLPDGRVIAPHRPMPRLRRTAATATAS
ncbi:DUF5999 family protein [Actinomadura keratinilytica]|uniref:Amidohydrolase 3 domain-containing protein n=1 Tax=Actinomadura keratinilytica TaxID=547461 RepID=A0ABP7ZB18_9ACTN